MHILCTFLFCLLFGSLCVCARECADHWHLDISIKATIWCCLFWLDCLVSIVCQIIRSPCAYFISCACPFARRCHYHQRTHDTYSIYYHNRFSKKQIHYSRCHSPNSLYSVLRYKTNHFNWSTRLCLSSFRLLVCCFHLHNINSIVQCAWFTNPTNSSNSKMHCRNKTLLGLTIFPRRVPRRIFSLRTLLDYRFNWIGNESVSNQDNFICTPTEATRFIRMASMIGRTADRAMKTLYADFKWHA